MKKVALAILTVVILLMPCISQADGRELIIEDFEDTSLPADKLFLPEDLSGWGILPPDSMEYSAEGAQNGNGLLAVFGESGGTQTYWIEQDWVAQQLAPALSEYNYFRLWVDNKTGSELRITIVLAENLDLDPAIRKAGYLPVEEVYGVWEEDGYVDELDGGPSLCDPDNNPDASIFVPSEFRGYVYWAIPESVDELVLQTAWGVSNISSFDAVAAMMIDVRGTYSPDGNSYLFDSLGVSDGWEEENGADSTAPAEGTHASDGVAGTVSAGAPTETQSSNTGLYIAIAAAAVVVIAVIIIVIYVVKKKRKADE